MERLHQQHDAPEIVAVIDKAIAAGAAIYIRDCESQIPEFVRRHYSFRGALRIHAQAIGWDMLRMPVNIVWSVLNVVLALLGLIARLLGFKKLRAWIQTIPPGLQTDMDRQIGWLIVTEWLELPYAQGQKVSDKDALMAAILEDPDLRSLLDDTLDVFAMPSRSPEFSIRLAAKLAEYGATRTASSDLASNAALLVTSKLTLGQASFGALSAGTALSATLAHSAAVSGFWLGSTLGSYYYAIFPVAASVWLLLAVTGVIAVLLALIATFIGILTDPLQAMLGIHQKRLKKLIAAIGDDLRGNAASEFQLREKYAGRLFDIVDILSAVGRSM